MNYMDKKQVGPKGQNLNIDIKQTTPIACECGSEVFIPAMKFRQIPKLLTGSKENQLFPAQVFMCVSCGVIPEQFDLDIA